MTDQTHGRKGALAIIAIPLAVVMLVAWAIGTFAWTGPGWIHILLTLGVFLLIYGIVVRGDRAKS